MSLNKLAMFSKKLDKYSPEILTGLGIAGMITSTVLAVKSTPKALELIEDAESSTDEKTTFIDKTRICWKLYLPSISLTVASIGCFIGATSTNNKRKTALAAAYSLSETAFSDYRRKVVETLGENKDRQIQDEIAKEKVEQNPVQSREIIITEKGSTLFYDITSDRYFKSDIELIRKAANVVNRQIVMDGYASLNDLYYEFGLNETRHGADFGWNCNYGLIDVYFTAVMTEDEQPCIAINYRISPRYGFDSFD